MARKSFGARPIGRRAGEASAGAPAYSVYVNHRVGRLLAAIAHARGLTPNQVTAMISASHTSAGILVLVLVPIGVRTRFTVAGRLALGYAWEAGDGRVARLCG